MGSLLDLLQDVLHLPADTFHPQGRFFTEVGVTISLGDYVEEVKRAANPPGANFFPGSTDAEWAARLSDAFWKARLADFFSGYAEADGDVRNTSGGADLDRVQVEVIIQFAALTALQQKLTSMATMSRSKAGPVEVETQRSAQMLVERLKEIAAELNGLRDTVRTRRRYGSTAFLDLVAISAQRTLDGAGWVNGG